MVANKQFLNYPNHLEFEELLNSCGSMTKQLENLGHKLSINLLAEGNENNYFRRYTELNLNNKPVVTACSSTLLSNKFFTSLLQQANTNPIGKFLFTKDNQIQRKNNMVIQLVTQSTIEPLLRYYLTLHNYQADQLFWQRKSVFEYRAEKLQLTEILLPELDSFF